MNATISITRHEYSAAVTPSAVGASLVWTDGINEWSLAFDTLGGAVIALGVLDESIVADIPTDVARLVPKIQALISAER